MPKAIILKNDFDEFDYCEACPYFSMDHNNKMECTELGEIIWDEKVFLKNCNLLDKKQAIYYLELNEKIKNDNFLSLYLKNNNL